MCPLIREDNRSVSGIEPYCNLLINRRRSAHSTTVRSNELAQPSRFKEKTNNLDSACRSGFYRKPRVRVCRITTLTTP